MYFTQNPNGFNVTGTPLVYSVTSSNAGQPQFRYEFTISGPSGFVADNVLKVYPNKEGIGTIDISNIADTYAESYLNADLTTYGAGGIPRFEITVREEYATDFNSIPSYGPGYLYTELTLLRGYKNINDDTGTGYDFDFEPYMILSSGAGDKKLLTSDPSVFHAVNYVDRRHTEEKQYVPRSGGSLLGAIYALAGPNVDFEFNILGWDKTDDIISQDSIAFSNSGVLPRIFSANATPLFPGQYTNLIANWDNIAYYDFLIVGCDYVMRHYVLDDCEISDKTSFAWMNEFGVYDHYFVSNPRRRRSNVTRYDYDRPFVRYEDSDSSYNITNRGKRQYLTEYDYTYSVTTDYLTEKQAKWLSGMFESDDVYVANFEGQDSVYKENRGIQIVNSSYEVNNSTSRNKLFQYTIDFKFNTQFQDR